MPSVVITYSSRRNIAVGKLLPLYKANNWSSAEKPALLKKALADSHAVVAAWHGATLVGLGNAISDGHLVVYYPHMLVHPDYQGRGIGTEIMRRLKENYRGFHQHVLIADGRAIEFYRKCGFTRAGRTESMWIYAGTDH